MIKYKLLIFLLLFFTTIFKSQEEPITDEAFEPPTYKLEWYSEDRPVASASNSDKAGFCKMCCVCETNIDRPNFMQVTKPTFDKLATFYFPIEPNKLDTLDQSIIEIYYCNNVFLKGLPLRPDDSNHYKTYKWYDFHSNYYKELNSSKMLNLIEEPIPEQATQKQCLEDCKCTGKTDKTRKMASEEILKMKEEELKKFESEEGGENAEGEEKKYKKTDNGDEMFDMSMLKLDNNAGLEIGNMAKEVTKKVVDKAIKEAGGLSLWNVLKLIMLIISLKLMYVTFKSQYYMAVMAAQAPLMMMNPMSMFGFNPMNYSSALENAGYPAKFMQVGNINKDGGIGGNGFNPGYMNNMYGINGMSGLNMNNNTGYNNTMGMYGPQGYNKPYFYGNQPADLNNQTRGDKGPKSYYDTMKSYMGFAQKPPDPPKISKQDLLNNIDVFYDNFRKGFDVASKEKNFSNIYGMINNINSMNSSILQGGQFVDNLINNQRDKVENINTNVIKSNPNTIVDDKIGKFRNDRSDYKQKISDNNSNGKIDVSTDKNEFRDTGNEKLTENDGKDYSYDESIQIVQGLLKHNYENYLNKVSKFKQYDRLNDNKSKKGNKNTVNESKKEKYSNKLKSSVDDYVSEFNENLQEIKEKTSSKLLDNIKHYVNNAKEYYLPEKQYKAYTLGDMIGTLNFFNSNKDK